MGKLAFGLVGSGKIPLWVKVAFTLFLAVVVPAYWHAYTPWNFLWFCDVAMFVTCLALWLESPFLTSVAGVGIILPQLLWAADFLVALSTGGHRHLIGLADYMFDPKYPLFIRLLSLFHGWLPFLLLWMLGRLGFDRRAWLAQTVLAWGLLLVCYFFGPMPPAPASNPDAAVNINWVFGIGETGPQQAMAPGLYLLLQLAFYPVCIYLPSNFVLRAVFRRAGGVSGGPNHG
jgi:hypothetical protein